MNPQEKTTKKGSLSLASLKGLVTSAVAVYVGDDFVDIVDGRLAPGGIRVRYLQRFPVLTPIKGKPFSEIHGEIARILEKSGRFKKNGLQKVAINLRMENVLLRRFQMRPIPEDEMRRALSFEAQRYIPYPIDEMRFCFRQRKRADGHIEVIFLAVQKLALKDAVDFYQQRHLLPATIESVPAAMAQAIAIDDSLKHDKTILSLHFEPGNKALITGIWQKTPYFMREIDVFPSESEFKTTELLYPRLEEAWSAVEYELSQSIEYMKRETKEEVAKIVISGFNPSLDEKKIQERFGMPIQRLSLKTFSGITALDHHRYAPALALLHSSLKKPQINLAPDSVTYKDPVVYKPVLQRSAIVLAAILLLHGGLVIFNGFNQRRVSAIHKEFDSYRVLSSSMTTEEIVDAQAIVSRKAEYIDGIIKRRILLTDKLSRLGRRIARNMWVDIFQFKNSFEEDGANSLKLTGGVLAFVEEGVVTVNKVLMKIKKDEMLMAGFTDGDLSSVAKKIVGGSEITQFELTLKK